MEIAQYIGYANRENVNKEDIIRVEFGKTCKTIGQKAFNGCTNLTSEIIIREGITLGYYAFNGSGITKLTIGNGISMSGNKYAGSFANCSNLTEVIIGDYVTIEPGEDVATFANCTNLKKVTMGENIRMPNNHWAYNWFSGCTALEEVTVKSLSEVGTNAFWKVGAALKGNIVINEGVTKIGVDAFYGCTNITSVKIANTVTEIGMDSFNSCINLSSIIIPDAVTNIGQRAFNGCTNLESEIIIREGTTLGYYAFNGSGITKLTIENGISMSGNNYEGSFANCNNLTDVIIGDDVTIYPGGNVATFANCTNLKKVTMGENIKMPNNHWAYNWFVGCTALEEVTVKSLSEVGQNAFSNVGPALKGNIVIKEGATQIGVNAFKGCTNITNVKIPNTVTEIGMDSFNSCINLSSIIIPGMVTNIGNRAFSGCTGLTKIQVDMTEEEFNNVTKGSNWNSGVTATIEYLK